MTDDGPAPRGAWGQEAETMQWDAPNPDGASYCRPSSGVEYLQPHNEVHYLPPLNPRVPPTPRPKVFLGGATSHL